MTLEEQKAYVRLGAAQSACLRPLISLLQFTVDYAQPTQNLVQAAEEVLKRVEELRTAACVLLPKERP